MAGRREWGYDRVTTRVLASHACAAVALSLPFPALVAMLAEQSVGPVAIGAAGAARMLPYVALAWFAGLLADRFRRDLVVRRGLWIRLACAVGTTWAMTADRPWTALALATVAVAVSLPAYPALVAALPSVAGRRAPSAVDLLVTIEVGAFVAGAALGGLLLHPDTRAAVPLLAAALTATAIVAFHHVRLDAPTSEEPSSIRHAYGLLLRTPGARRAVGVMTTTNLVEGFLAMALLSLAIDSWRAGTQGYGVATAVLGFAAFAAPAFAFISGRSARAGVRRLLPLLALAVLLVIPAGGVGQAAPALFVIGAVSVAVEARATRLLTAAVPDEVRATVLGINDAVIVAAAMLGTFVAPWAMAHAPAPALLTGCAAILVLPLLGVGRLATDATAPEVTDLVEAPAVG